MMYKGVCKIEITTIPNATIYDLIIDIMMTGFNQYQRFCINVGWNIKPNCSIVFNYTNVFCSWNFQNNNSVLHCIALYANYWLSVLIWCDPICKTWKLMDSNIALIKQLYQGKRMFNTKSKLLMVRYFLLICKYSLFSFSISLKNRLVEGKCIFRWCNQCGRCCECIDNFFVSSRLIGCYRYLMMITSNKVFNENYLKIV